jgi:hypothetical protein
VFDDEGFEIKNVLPPEVVVVAVPVAELPNLLAVIFVVDVVGAVQLETVLISEFELTIAKY